MVWLRNFYRRRKTPWVGFVLVLFFGPFGFLYHSWKTTLGVLFVAGPAWIIFLRHTPFDVIENPWAHYVALLILACFAFLQTKALHSKADQELKATKLVCLVSDPTSARGLAEFINKHSELKKKFLAFGDDPALGCDNTMVRFNISRLFVNYAMLCGDNGDFVTATSSAFYAWAFAKENISAISVQAEIYLAWEDRIAARYADKVLEWEPPKSEGVMEKVFAAPEVLAVYDETKERMKVIIRECEAHPEWRDSYPLKKASGTVEELL